MSPVTLYIFSMTGSYIIGIVGLYKVYIFFSAFNTLSCADVSVLASFLWHVNYDDFEFSFNLTLFPSSEIMYT